MAVEVHNDFVVRMRENIWKRCPSTLTVTGLMVEDLFHEIPRPCRLRSLLFSGDINYLEMTIDYIVASYAIFELLDFVSYYCSPIPTTASILAYACCATSIIPPPSFVSTDRTVTLFLRIPVKHLVGDGYTLHRFSVNLSLADPETSILTFYSVTRGNFV